MRMRVTSYNQMMKPITVLTVYMLMTDSLLQRVWCERQLMVLCYVYVVYQTKSLCIGYNYN